MGSNNPVGLVCQILFVSICRKVEQLAIRLVEIVALQFNQWMICRAIGYQCHKAIASFFWFLDHLTANSCTFTNTEHFLFESITSRKTQKSILPSGPSPKCYFIFVDSNVKFIMMLLWQNNLIFDIIIIVSGQIGLPTRTSSQLGSYVEPSFCISHWYIVLVSQVT